MTATELIALCAILWAVFAVVSIVLDWLANSPKRRFRPRGDERPVGRAQRRRWREQRRHQRADAIRRTLAAGYGRTSLRWFGRRRGVLPVEALDTASAVPSPSPTPDAAPPVLTTAEITVDDLDDDQRDLEAEIVADVDWSAPTDDDTDLDDTDLDDTDLDGSEVSEGEPDEGDESVAAVHSLSDDELDVATADESTDDTAAESRNEAEDADERMAG